MASGDSANILARLKSLLPARWFSDPAPVLNSVGGGLADGLSASYELIAYAQAQTRLQTATGFWLDLIAFDFFALRFTRRKSQPDASFRDAIKKEIFRVRATRPGMAQAMLDLTGVAPIIFEPANPRDTGAYGMPTLGYSVAGRYGSIALVNQVYMDVCRPLGQGIPFIAGYGAAASGYSDGSSTFEGRGEYTGPDQVDGPVTDLDIYRTVEAVRPVGVTVWTRIEDALPPPDLAPSYIDLLTPADDFLVMPDGGHIYVSGPT
jgi:hypothetical protein